MGGRRRTENQGDGRRLAIRTHHLSLARTHNQINNQINIIKEHGSSILSASACTRTTRDSLLGSNELKSALKAASGNTKILLHHYHLSACAALPCDVAALSCRSHLRPRRHERGGGGGECLSINKCLKGSSDTHLCRRQQRYKEVIR
jgi:hypothetical protein